MITEVLLPTAQAVGGTHNSGTSHACCYGDTLMGISLHIVTPHAHARSGVKQSVLSVSRLSVVCQVEKIEISPHRPSKNIQMESNNSK